MATYWENSCSFGLQYVSWYKYLIVSLVFSHLGFWSGNLFLIAPFTDLCLLVPFFEIVEDRSASIFIPIIKRYIKPGSIILSDCWKAYSSLKDEGYGHLSVNHSIEFKNKDTGACRNLIESTWNAVKNHFPDMEHRRICMTPTWWSI